MADEIFVINVGGYIGASTRSEIEYAIANGKRVRYLEGEDGVPCDHQGGGIVTPSGCDCDRLLRLL